MLDGEVVRHFDGGERLSICDAVHNLHENNRQVLELSRKEKRWESSMARWRSSPAPLVDRGGVTPYVSLRKVPT